MSTNATTTPSTAPAAGALIQSYLNALLIGHTFLILLLPLLNALFYFSTPRSRQRPIFILNVVVIMLAFAGGVIVDALTIHTILSSLDPWPQSVNFAIGFIGAFQSILVDLILLLRLISVHPLRHLGPTRFAMLTALPISLKIGRVVNLIIFIKVLVETWREPGGTAKVVVLWMTAPYLKIEWFAQMVDNTYASITFLWTIRYRGGEGVTSHIHPTRMTFAQRMRTLSRIALSNFLIPTLFSIAQLIVVYRSVDPLIVNEIIYVNTMLAVFGVVFASVWAGSTGREERDTTTHGARRGRWHVERDGDDESTRTRAEAEDKRAKHVFAYPGLESWHAASTPPKWTVGSVVPVEEVDTPHGLDGHAHGDRDVLVIGGGSGTLAVDSESVKVDEVVVV